MFYRFLFRVFFVRLDPEIAHELVAWAMKLASSLGLLRAKRVAKTQTIMGIDFENALGMAAGFDKNGTLIRPLHALGFGHVEIGTVTPVAQGGNPQPRLFRLPKNKSLINRMGFNNDGAEVVARRVKTLRMKHKNLPVIGINIGKNKSTSELDAASDYQMAAKLLAPVADYLVINVSSPNTQGLRDLQRVSALRPILEAVQSESGDKPVLLKIAPDLANDEILEILQLAIELSLAGLVLSNTTISREGLISEANVEQTGGLSGPPLASKALKTLKLVRELSPASMVLISVGGLTDRADFTGRISSGANLVQGYTGFVYAGPLWARRLTRS
ncbi:MAG: quinone-dependent dihydroorotate dehydrogenase [Aquiluna sp.]|nr:quinone-dependent dihydroorotate dehydrogenase [Aquiluna sp.]